MSVRMIPAIAAAAAFASASAVAQVKWDFPTPYADREVLTKNTVQFAEDVRRATNGQLVITMHTAQSLIKNPEIKRAVQTGQVQIGEIFKPNMGPEDPVFELDAIPFFAPGYKEARALLEVSRCVWRGQANPDAFRVVCRPRSRRVLRCACARCLRRDVVLSMNVYVRA